MNIHTQPGRGPGQLDLTASKDNDEPTPTEFRGMLINACADFDASMGDTKPIETAEEAVDNALARGRVRYPGGQLVPVVQEPEPDDDENAVWGIEAQAEIEISRLPGGSVLIHEPPGPGTQAEGERIVVTAGNAVAFARRVLWAAGFKGVLIATSAGGGYCDLEDGDTAGEFAPERQKPGYGPVAGGAG